MRFKWRLYVTSTHSDVYLIHIIYQVLEHISHHCHQQIKSQRFQASLFFFYLWSIVKNFSGIFNFYLCLWITPLSLGKHLLGIALWLGYVSIAHRQTDLGQHPFRNFSCCFPKNISPTFLTNVKCSSSLSFEGQKTFVIVKYVLKFFFLKSPIAIIYWKRLIQTWFEQDTSKCQRELSRTRYLWGSWRCPPGLPGDGGKAPFNCHQQEKKHLGWGRWF